MKSFPRRRLSACLLPALAALLLALPGCRSLLTIPGQRLEVPPGADGMLGDFSKSITSQLFENGMMVGVGNDDANLYVFFSPDIRHQRRPPGRATLTVWVDDGGGRAKKLGLAFISETAPGGRPQAGNAPDADHDAPPAPPMGSQGLTAQPLLKVIDRQGKREAFIAADGSPGPCVRLSSDWGDFAYQLRIPLQTAAGGDWPGLRSVPGKAVGIGLDWRYEPLLPSGREGKGRFAEGSPPGEAEGGMPEMGPRGGRGGGRDRGRGLPGERATNSRSAWLKTLLLAK
jgi:hypothetical protein